MITSKPKPIVHLSGALLTLLLTFFLAIYLFENGSFSASDWLVLVFFTFCWFVIAYWRKKYSKLDTELRRQIYNHVKAYLAFLILVFLFYLIFPDYVPKNRGIGILLGLPVLVLTINYFLVKLLGFIRNNKLQTKYTLVAGVGSAAKNVAAQLLAQRVPGYQIKGFVHCKKHEACAVEQDKVVSDLRNIGHYLKDNPVDEIVIASPGKLTVTEIKNILSAADYHGIRVKYILDYQEIFGSNYKITRYGQIDAVSIRQLPLDNKVSSFIKTVFDKLFSGLLLVFLAPLFVVLAVLIKMNSAGPVFYCPYRIGRSGKAFKLYKFRSMRENDAASGGTLSTKKDDPRVTKLGKVLRKYSLDELPQLINVFLGNMSLIGPRPHRKFLNQQLQASEYHYMVRHYVKPGITGWAQVNGWRGPTDTEEQKRQRTVHDLWYIENWSIWLDLKILYLTVFSKKVHNGAY